MNPEDKLAEAWEECSLRERQRFLDLMASDERHWLLTVGLQDDLESAAFDVRDAVIEAASKIDPGKAAGL